MRLTQVSDKADLCQRIDRMRGTIPFDQSATGYYMQSHVNPFRRIMYT